MEVRRVYVLYATAYGMPYALQQIFTSVTGSSVAQVGLGNLRPAKGWHGLMSGEPKILGDTNPSLVALIRYYPTVLYTNISSFSWTAPALI